MRRVQGSKSVVCSKKELAAIYDLCWGFYKCKFYELPLFSLNPESKKFSQIETEYILIKPGDYKFTQTFLDRINKTWSKMYE